MKRLQTELQGEIWQVGGCPGKGSVLGTDDQVNGSNHENSYTKGYKRSIRYSVIQCKFRKKATFTGN
jgi:hypothetical protein